MTKRKGDRIQNALNFNPFSDTDGDGVPNILDCNPNNPLEHGFFGEVGRAAKERVGAEISELRERTIKGISGEEARKHKKELQEAEREAYLEAAKKEVEERGREKARAKFKRRKPLRELLGRYEDDDISEFGDDIRGTLKKAGKHGKGILRETARSRVKTKMPDVKLPDTSLGGITGKDVLTGTLRTIKPRKRKTKLKVGTKMPDVPLPDVSW